MFDLNTDPEINSLFSSDIGNQDTTLLTKIKSHRNLNAKPKKTIEWSVTPLNGDLKGKVLCYSDWLLLEDVYFRVQPKGVDRIRERKVRSVVAWAEGTVTSWSIKRIRYEDNNYQFPTKSETPNLDNWDRVIFDVFQGEKYFTLADSLKPVTHAKKVLLAKNGACFALSPVFISKGT
jgi:hypothetical protein